MALFQPTTVTLALETLTINSADDRWWDVEPYVVPIFFKVDGERYLARLGIQNSENRGEGDETSSLAGGLIELTVDTVETGTWPTAAQPDIHHNNPWVVAHPGSLLGRGSFDSGGHVNMSDVSYSSTLYPIPFRIDVQGTYMSAAEAFEGLLVPLEGLYTAINLVFVKLDDFIGGLFGLDEEFESCPTDVGSSDFLKDIDAQFNAMIPGTIGGVFVLMENDAFDIDLVNALRDSIKEEVAHVINHVVNAISEAKITPSVDSVTDKMDFEGDIESDLTMPFLGDIGITAGAIGLSIGALLLGALVIAIPLGLYGILTALSWLIGGFDDKIGVVQMKFGHSDLVGLGPGDSIPDAISSQEEDGDNEWTLSYRLTINSIGVHF